MRKIILLTLTSILLFATSEELYRNCASCHGKNGELAALSQSKVITGQDKNLSIKQLVAYKNGELDKYGLGNIMKLQLMLLNEENIEDLAEYISKMQPKESVKE
ncbi:MAG: Unknown protein [uncultured Sulfurovum sp.]|uniref:Cytochrome c domain-containing protein n=1 Tax=uncultured Sulfurovum sp. TaxID=269237 RepID=A0A6S6S9Y8_9BACT|nr:MAG: Unknown protein [uncultured Sulfurovum sp.]